MELSYRSMFLNTDARKELIGDDQHVKNQLIASFLEYSPDIIETMRE